MPADEACAAGDEDVHRESRVSRELMSDKCFPTKPGKNRTIGQRIQILITFPTLISFSPVVPEVLKE
jgi:hypothetical protein